MGEEYHVASKSVKGLIEELGWSLASGRDGLDGLSSDKHPARNAFTEGLSNYPPYSMVAPRATTARCGRRIIPWGGRGMCEQKSTDDAFFLEKVACLDCTLMKIQSRRGFAEAD